MKTSPNAEKRMSSEIMKIKDEVTGEE